MENKMVKISDLRKVKGIGAKTIERIKEQFDESEYVSEYDEGIHIEPNSLVQGDMLEVMNGIPDKSVDMILTDLPYGTTACSWDSVIDFDKMWKQYSRVIKDNGAIVLFGSQPFTSMLISSNVDDFKYEWVWDKHIPRNFINAKIMPMQKHENILVFGKGKIKYLPQMIERDKPVTVRNYSKGDSVYSLNDSTDSEFRTYTHRNPDTIIVGKWEANAGKQHPTQKPLSLIEYLVKTYTDEGDLVLDSTMGSGTTPLGAKNLGRKYIGIELDREYYRIAKKRVNGNL